MNVYGLSAQGDMGVRIAAEWEADVYARVSCAICRALLPSVWDRSLDIHLDGAYIREGCLRGAFSLASSMLNDKRYANARGLAGPHVIVEGAHAGIVRQDLAKDLALADRGFSLGRVMIDGVAQQEYVTFIAARSSRVMMQNNGVTKRQMCPKCGWLGRNLDFEAPTWFKRASVGDRDVFVNEPGTWLHVNRAGLERIRPGIRAGMRIEEVEVRDAKGPDQMPERH